ncbi:MAG: CHASE2 domain-containing protein [Leptolyngbyaceae cyanobacterium MO_188.B28]|nr:CHASE2 domain-containing protein [Leptolyngbyaceae cyanobacterium MO_188.B28]
MSTLDNHSEARPKPKGRIKRLLQTVVLTGLIVTGGLAACRFLGWFEKIEIAAYDSFIRRKPVEPLDDRLLVIGISEEDIQNREEYPIKEGTVVELLETMTQYEPRVIALDFGLDFPRGTDAEQDQLTNLLAGSDRIVSACLLSSEEFPGVPPAPSISEELAAFADFPQDSDGIVRRSLMVSTPGEVFVDEVVRSHLCNRPGEVLFSLSLLLAMIYLEDEGIFAEQTESGDLTWGNTVVSGLYKRSGGYADTGAVDYQVMLNYRGPRDTVRTVSLTKVLQGKVNPEWVRDRVVLVGYTSPVVKDFIPTPYTETEPGFRGMFGVIAHAQATSQLISAVLDGRPLIRSWPEIGEIGLIGVMSLIGGLIAFYARHPILFGAALIGGLVGLWFLAYYIFIQGLWLPVASMIAAVLATAIVVSVIGRASHSVYAQAILEQLKADIQGWTTPHPVTHRDRLEELVRRAQAIRQKRAIGDELGHREVEQSSADPMHLEFDDPEVQTFYERIKTQLQQKFDQEKAALEAQTNRQGASSKSLRVQSLLKKSQRARSANLSSPLFKSGGADD